MARFARVDAGHVSEVVELPKGVAPADAFHAALAATFVACGADVQEGWSRVGSKFAPPAPASAPVPAKISSAQAKIMLSRAGLLAAVKALVAQIGGEVEIWFTDAREWERQNPYVLEFAKPDRLNLSEAQLDELFRGAAQIAA